MEADLEVLPNVFDGGVYLGKHLMLGRVEEPVPRDDFRIFDEQSPPLNEVAVGRALVCQRALNELVKLAIALPDAVKVDARGFGRALMMLAETSYTRRCDGLRVTRAERVQERPVALVE